MRACHCDTYCQDDDGVKTGVARKCADLLRYEASLVPNALVIDYLACQPGSYMVTFAKPLTPEQLATLKMTLGIHR